VGQPERTLDFVHHFTLITTTQFDILCKLGCISKLSGCLISVGQLNTEKASKFHKNLLPKNMGYFPE